MSKSLTVVFDMDGVIAEGTKEDVYSHSAGWAYEKCTPIHSTIDIMQGLIKRGVRIVIHTARWESDRAVTEKWLRKNCVPYNKLVLGKPSADLYVDDRNYPASYPASEIRDIPSEIVGIMRAATRNREQREQ